MDVTTKDIISVKMITNWNTVLLEPNTIAEFMKAIRILVRTVAKLIVLFSNWILEFAKTTVILLPMILPKSMLTKTKNTIKVILVQLLDVLTTITSILRLKHVLLKTLSFIMDNKQLLDVITKIPTTTKLISKTKMLALRETKNVIAMIIKKTLWIYITLIKLEPTIVEDLITMLLKKINA